MAWTQSDSDVFFERLRNIARQHLSSAEEGARLISLAASEVLATNLTDASDGSATKGEAIAFKGVIDDFADFFAGFAVATDANRRQKIDAFLANDGA